MPKLTISENCTLSADQAYAKVKALFTGDQDLLKLDPQLTCQFDDGRLGGTAKGQHFKAEMNVVPAGSGSTIQLTIDLPFHLALLKGTVEKTIKKKLGDTLNS